MKDSYYLNEFDSSYHSLLLLNRKDIHGQDCKLLASCFGLTCLSQSLEYWTFIKVTFSILICLIDISIVPVDTYILMKN